MGDRDRDRRLAMEVRSTLMLGALMLGALKAKGLGICLAQANGLGIGHNTMYIGPTAQPFVAIPANGWPVGPIWFVRPGRYPGRRPGLGKCMGHWPEMQTMRSQTVTSN